MDVRKKWQHREDIGETSVLEKMQQLGERMIDYSFISTRIKYLSEYLIWLEKETRRNYVGVEVLSKRLVMSHGSIRGSAVNVTKKTKHHFFGIKFLRHTTPHHIQLSLSMKRC